jgi:hypothetical protein
MNILSIFMAGVYRTRDERNEPDRIEFVCFFAKSERTIEMDPDVRAQLEKVKMGAMMGSCVGLTIGYH